MSVWSVKATNLQVVGSPPATFTFDVFFRIAPLYYCALMFAFLLAPYTKEGWASLQATNPSRWLSTPWRPEVLRVEFDNFLVHISFVFGLLPRYGISSALPDWSIGLEMQFYTIFPLLMWGCRKVGPITSLLLACLVGLAIKALMPFIFGSQQFIEPSFLPLKLPLFLLGMALALANHCFFNDDPVRAALLLMFATLLASHFSVYIILLGGLLVMNSPWFRRMNSLSEKVGGLVSALLGCRVARFLADTSYAVYLFHGFFIFLGGGWLYTQPWALSFGHRLPLLTILVLIGSYGLGFILHRTVERPAIAFGRKLIKRLEKLPP